MNESGGDGHYHLRGKIDKNIFFESFGYYTNGSSIEEEINIHIYEDTTIIVYPEWD
jgi:hypothetical protein